MDVAVPRITGRNLENQTSVTSNLRLKYEWL